jgi:hypothetical protein
MSDFLNHLVARATGTAEQITPRPASRFEPDGWQPDGDFEELAATTMRRLVSEPPAPTPPVREPVPQPPPREERSGPALPPPDVEATAPAAPWARPEPPAPTPPEPPADITRRERLPATDPQPAPAPAAAAVTPAPAIAAGPEPRNHPGVVDDVVETRRVTVTTHLAVVDRVPVEQVVAVPALQARAAAPPVPPGLRPDPPASLAPDREPVAGPRSPGPDPAPPAAAPAPDAPPIPAPGEPGEERAERAETASETRPAAPDPVDPPPRLDRAPRRWPAAEPSRQAEPYTPAAEPPSVEVHIGRIEIRSAATPPPAARKRADRSRVMPLDEYLTRRRGGS